MARILIVDDEQDLLDTLTPLLRSQGHEVVPVSEPPQALELLRGEPAFDLLVTDLRMAPVDGLKLMAFAARKCPRMDVLVLSAYLDQETLQKVRGLGCSACVRKPFEIADLLDTIQSVLAKRESGDRASSPSGDGEPWIV